MTELRKPVARVVPIRLKGVSSAAVVVTLTLEGLLFREKGRRRSFLLPYHDGYFRAVRLEADRQVAERKAARNAKRAARSR